MADHQLFAVSSGVEVSSNKVGFRGSWYLATIIDWRRNKVLVEHVTLLAGEDKEELFKEWADVSFVRPLPLLEEDDDEDCLLYEVVDGSTRDGWWTGVVIKVVEGGGAKRFVVFF